MSKRKYYRRKRKSTINLSNEQKRLLVSNMPKKVTTYYYEESDLVKVKKGHLSYFRDFGRNYYEVLWIIVYVNKKSACIYCQGFTVVIPMDKLILIKKVNKTSRNI